MNPLDQITPTDLALFRSRFVNRDDVYARQWDDGAGWTRVAAPLTDDVLRSHLRGEITIGFYTPDLAGQTRWLCVDFDTSDGVKRGQQLQLRLAQRGAPSLVELSANGRCHVWLFFVAPTPAGPIRQAMYAVLNDLGWPVEPGVVEIFPKHDHIEADAFGSLVRGPLGRHRKVGGAIFPLVRYDRETGRYFRGGLSTLLSAATADPAVVIQMASGLVGRVSTASGETASTEGAAAKRDPVKRSPLTEEIYRRTSVRQILAEKGIEVNRAGKAQCPFHDDHHPSLQDYGTHFYCFGCGAKGDVITLFQKLNHYSDRWRARDMLCDHLGLDPDEIRRAGGATKPPRRRERVIQLSFYRDLMRSA